MDVKQLDSKARQVAKDYKRLEQQLLDLVIQIDKNKIFYKLGFNSLFKYLTDALELSPAIACAFTNVARKSLEVPELKHQVESGRLSIYKAQRITSVLTPENSKTWLALAESKTHRELEREVAIASPKNAVQEKARYVSPLEGPMEKLSIKRDIPRMELHLGVSEQLMLKIRRAQDLESQRNKRNLSLEQTLEEVMSVYLEKRDPLKKAYRQKAKGKLQTTHQRKMKPILQNSQRKKMNERLRLTDSHKVKQNFPMAHPQKVQGNLQIAPKQKCCDGDKNRARAKLTKREALPARLRHQLQIREKSQCAYVDLQGKRCSAKRYLEAHHLKPVAQGGENSLENLILLCSGHHKSIHRRQET